MTKLLKIARWFACLPGGMLGGLLAATTCLVIVGLGLDHFWLPGFLGCLVAGLVYPIAAYRLGLAIAPNRSERSRNVMLLGNWFLLFGAGSDLIGLYQGIAIEGADVFQAVSAWWVTLAFAGGIFAGCLWVFWQEDAESIRDEAPRQISTPSFSWTRTTNA